ncbi:MAG TPA: hypothetical protein VKW09_08625 [bacterium]|nr:hypothetical protein [bacterium]
MKGVAACLGMLAVLVATQSAWADIHISLTPPASYPSFDVGTAVDPGPDRALIVCEYCNSLNNGLKFLKMGTLAVSPMLVTALDALQMYLVTKQGGFANLVDWKF